MAEESTDRSSHPALVGRRIAREKWKIVCLAVLLLLSGGGWLVVKHWAVEQNVAVRVAADQGITSITLDSRTRNAISPGCGCMDPRMGDYIWHGMEIPSQGFDLGVNASRRSSDTPSGWWGLVALSPDLDTTDWYGEPFQPIQMTATVARDGRNVRVFKHTVASTTLLIKGKVTVEHGSKYPYTALLPAAGGRTQFKSSAGAYDGSGGRLDITTSAFAHGAFNKEFRHKYKRGDPSVTQNGPMIDVLGPTITIEVPHGRNVRAYAGAERLPDLARSGEVDITLRPAYSVRLIPFPASSSWTRKMATGWPEAQRTATTKQERAFVKGGPFLTPRIEPSGPLPPYHVRISDVTVPDASVWERFAKASRGGQVIKPFIRFPDGMVVIYALPPVSTRSQVGVFGNVTELDTSSMSGDVLVRSSDTDLGQGQSLRVRSAKGLTAGDFRLAPLVSSGGPTATSSLHGKARVWVAGNSITGVSGGIWAIGTLVTSVFALALGVLLDAVTDARREDE